MLSTHHLQLKVDCLAGPLNGDLCTCRQHLTPAGISTGRLGKALLHACFRRTHCLCADLGRRVRLFSAAQRMEPLRLCNVSDIVVSQPPMAVSTALAMQHSVAVSTANSPLLQSAAVLGPAVPHQGRRTPRPEGRMDEARPW